MALTKKEHYGVNELIPDQEIPLNARGVSLDNEKVTVWHTAVNEIIDTVSARRTNTGIIKLHGYDTKVIFIRSTQDDKVSSTIMTPGYEVRLHPDTLGRVAMVAASLAIPDANFYDEIAAENRAKVGFVLIKPSDEVILQNPDQPQILITIHATNEIKLTPKAKEPIRVFQAGPAHSTTVGADVLAYAPSNDKSKPTFIIQVAQHSVK